MGIRVERAGFCNGPNPPLGEGGRPCSLLARWREGVRGGLAESRWWAGGRDERCLGDPSTQQSSKQACPAACARASEAKERRRRREVLEELMRLSHGSRGRASLP